MIFTEIKGDLFALDFSNEFCLCHCVSEDLAMGKGIAVLFRDKFGCINELRRQSKSVGQVASLQFARSKIYYLITKPKYWDKPSYESLENALLSLRDDMISSDLNKLGMPRIGCGLDGLEWTIVKEVIKRVFASTSIEIVVCNK